MEAGKVDEKSKRVRMKVASEAMRGWSEALGREVEGWPGVTLKGAFGMTMVYRSGVVFAALPKTRAIYEEDAVMLKFVSETPTLAARIAAEKRFAAGTMEQRRSNKKAKGEGHKWRFFLMRENADLHAAMEWLGEAYRVAGKKGKSLKR
jgi:hypothetical protein